MKEEELFAKAISLSPADLAAFLESHCSSQPGLRQRIERLLQAHRETNVLDMPAASLMPNVESLVVDFELERQLGQHADIQEWLHRVSNDEQAGLREEFIATEIRSGRTPTRNASDAAWAPNGVADQTSDMSAKDDTSEALVSDQAPDRPLHLHGSTTTWAPERGMKIGKYRLEEKLGQGGMGTVFRASHSLIDHHVALKLMLPHLVQCPRLQKRFLKEAQVCVGLHHPNLVRTFDINEDGGCLYLTMELLSGCHLAERVANHGPMDSSETARVIRQMAEGLAYAHAQGIIHRDVKPQNVMLTEEGQVKVLDLGLAILLGDFGKEGAPRDSQEASNDWRRKLEQASGDLVTHDGRLTYVGTILGTLGYMSREQAIQPGVADVRNDIFSLGSTAYFLLTGKSIHGHRSPQEVLQRIISPRKWSDLSLEGVGDQWRPLLEKMLAWNAEDRFASMQEVIAAIEAAFDRKLPWKPDPDNLSQLREKLIELELVSDEQWNYAESKLETLGSTSTLSLDLAPEPRRLPTLALQFLFKLAQAQLPATGETILSQYQVQQILAGHAGMLRQGKHLIRESLNRGWKGGVFLAWDTESNRKETFRLLPREQLHGLELQADVEAAVNEIGARLQRMEHRQLAKIHLFELQGDWLLITSEYLTGETLREYVLRSRRQGAPLDEQAMVRIAIELASGIQYLHDQGCLHLDLSPDRWVKRETGLWCLLDGGWAQLLLSKHWKVMPQSAGLPPVLPPETMEDLENVSSRTDIYALGQVFRFLLTGEFPFRSMKLSEIERPMLPTMDRSLRSPSTELPSRSSESLVLPSLRKPRSASAVDWRVQWNELINAMTNANPNARPQAMGQVLQRLGEINASIQATSPVKESIEENMIHREQQGNNQKPQPSLFQRLRRLLGKKH